MNRLPKQFYRITAIAKSTADTIQPGDLLNLYSNDFGILAYNNRDNKYSYITKEFYRHDIEVLKVEM